MSHRTISWLLGNIIYISPISTGTTYVNQTMESIATCQYNQVIRKHTHLELREYPLAHEPIFSNGRTSIGERGEWRRSFASMKDRGWDEMISSAIESHLRLLKLTARR